VTAYWKGDTVEVTSATTCRGNTRERATWAFVVDGSGALLLRAYWEECLPSWRHRRWRETRSINRWPNTFMQRNGLQSLAEVPLDNLRACEILNAVLPTFHLKAVKGGPSLPTAGYKLSSLTALDADAAVTR
jgi:hypothetical protein